MTDHGCRKVTCLSIEIFYITMGKELNVLMTPHFYKFWGDYTHGAVICRKCLVQLGHLAADGGRAFHQVNLDPGVGKVQGRLHTADPAANNHYRTCW